MGHSDSTVTLRVYGHLFEGTQAKLSDQLDELRESSLRRAPQGPAPRALFHLRPEETHTARQRKWPGEAGIYQLEQVRRRSVSTQGLPADGVTRGVSHRPGPMILAATVRPRLVRVRPEQGPDKGVMTWRAT